MVKKIVENLAENWNLDDSKPVVVEKYDKVAVKNGIDDLTRKILNKKYNVTETYKTRDTRLAICSLACVFSLCGVVYDYLHPFPESKVVLGICSLSYFTITGLLYVWEWFVEKGTFYEGTLDGNTIRLSSMIPRYSGNYTLKGESTTGAVNMEYTKCISTWLAEDGTIVSDLVEAQVDQIYKSLFKSKSQ